jgi:hypothetical protein
MAGGTLVIGSLDITCIPDRVAGGALRESGAA